jgi:hypothetical protein
MNEWLFFLALLTGAVSVAWGFGAILWVLMSPWVERRARKRELKRLRAESLVRRL